MTQRFAELEKKRRELRQQLILGSARRDLEIPSALCVKGSKSASTLNVLAALSMRNHLDSPLAVDNLVTSMVTQRSSCLPDSSVRRLLCRLFSQQARYTTDAVPLRALDALSRAGCEVHPYDFPVLENWMAKDKDLASIASLKWLSTDTELTEESTSIDFDEVTDENWQELYPAMAIEYLRERRSENENEARDLCEKALQDNTAAKRVKLLDALSVNLSGGDVKLLLRCLEDRAASVRAQALRLLARIEGTEQHADRLSTAIASLNVKKSKILGPRTHINVTIPGNVAKSKRVAWVEEVFSGVDPEALCGTLDLKPKEFCAAVGDEDLRRTLTIGALEFGHLELATALARELSVRQRITMAHQRQVTNCPAQVKPLYWQILLAEVKPAAIEDLHWILTSLYVGLRCRPPQKLFADQLANKNWRSYCKNAKKDPESCDPEVAELFVALAPEGARATLDSTLRALPPMLTSRARQLSELFTRLESQVQD